MSSGTGTAFANIHGHSFADGRITGLGDACYLFGDAADDGHHFADTTAFTSDPPQDASRCDRISFQLDTVNDDDGEPMTGDWTIEVSNNYSPASTSTVYGQVSGNAGRWTDITAAFEPAIVAVTDNSSQFVQADIATRRIRVTFTPTAS